MLNLIIVNVGLVSTRFDNTGIGTYAREIANALPTFTDVSRITVDYKNRRIFESKDGSKKTIHRGRQLPIDHPGLFILRSRWSVSKTCDVYHFLSPSTSMLDLSPSVVTCHDMIKFKYPRTFSEKFVRQVEYQPLKSADKIIAVSESTKEDIIEILGIDEKKISTIYPGVDERYQPIDTDQNQLRKKYDLPESKNIILYLGSEEPRKNLSVAIEACRGVLDQDVSAHFVKAGGAKSFGNRQATVAALARNNMQRHATIINKIPEAELPALYNLADVFIFPSKYEGFGLPPLEAMACGTPVVCSNRSSLPEVVGEAGVLLNPHDVDGFSEALVKILTNKTYQLELIEAGIERSQMFSWERTAHKLYDEYQTVMS